MLFTCTACTVINFPMTLNFNLLSHQAPCNIKNLFYRKLSSILFFTPYSSYRSCDVDYSYMKLEGTLRENGFVICHLLDENDSLDW